MLQERLSELAILPIEKENLAKLEKKKKKTSSKFAFQKVRKTDL